METTYHSYNKRSGGVLQMIISIPLYNLVAVQLFFVILGLTFLNFSTSWTNVITALVTASVADILLARFVKKKPGLSFPASAIAGALGIAIFFRATSPWYFALATFLAIFSKYLFPTQSGHVFNPSNFGIVVVSFLFPVTTSIELTQWGSNPFVYTALSAIALIVAYRAGVLRATFSFLGTYTILLILMTSSVPDTFSAYHLGLLSPSLILFASFMITDPKSSPQGPRLMSIHGVTVAFLYFALNAIGVTYALFVSTFVLAILNAMSKLLIRTISADSMSLFNTVTAGVVFLFSFAVFGIASYGGAGFSSINVFLHFLFFGIG